MALIQYIYSSWHNPYRFIACQWNTIPIVTPIQYIYIIEPISYDHFNLLLAGLVKEKLNLNLIAIGDMIHYIPMRVCCDIVIWHMAETGEDIFILFKKKLNLFLGGCLLGEVAIARSFNPALLRLQN